MLYFRSFTVWGFTFKSLVHFKIIFVSALKGFSVTLLHMNI